MRAQSMKPLSFAILVAVLMLLAMFLAQKASAKELEVIYDNGHTRDVSNYLYDISPEEVKNEILKERQIKSPEELIELIKKYRAEEKKNFDAAKKRQGIKTLFPLDTGGLIVGKVNSRTVSFPALKVPLCIIGADDASLQWFDQIKYELKEQNGQCWLVQANGIADLKKVLSHSKGIVPVMPIPGSMAKNRFGISRYPALITADVITQ
ncbi:MAG: integrating conjugative element protein [Gammaproteobacteria bacterium]|nr:MAG: integrating conjugative element protein [Gammaproteobacteria bacterium]